MGLAEFAGYLAAILVFATFYMQTMVRLRIIGIASNVAFIAYGLLAGLVPILILHSALLPLNILRLAQLNRLTRDINAAAVGGLSVDALLPFMTARHAKAGQAIFRKGDCSREMYYLVRGRIRVEEIGRTLSAGDTFGEISMFSAQRRAHRQHDLRNRLSAAVDQPGARGPALLPAAEIWLFFSSDSSRGVSSRTTVTSSPGCLAWILLPPLPWGVSKVRSVPPS